MTPQLIDKIAVAALKRESITFTPAEVLQMVGLLSDYHRVTDLLSDLLGRDSTVVTEAPR